MVSKAVYASLFVCSLALQGHAHGSIAPMLGVTGTPVRGDVQRPSAAKPCGNINPATTIDNSQAATADAQGNVALTVTNFNAGADGSRKVSAQVSADGTGNNLAAAIVSTNGDAAPTNVGSQPLVVQLPAGTKCTGGKKGNLCLMALKTTSGFGNCVVVQQGGAAAPAAAANASAAAPAAANASIATPAAAANASIATPAAAANASAAAPAAAKKVAKGAKGAKANSKSVASNNATAANASIASPAAAANTSIAAPAAAANASAATPAAVKKVAKGAKANSKNAASQNATANGGNGRKVKRTNDMEMRATAPAGARAVRSILSAEAPMVKRSGFFSWVWA